MGIRILQGYKHEHSTTKTAVMFSSSTDWAFGPVFYDSEDGEHEAFDRAQLFIEWLPQDARLYEDSDLERKYSEFLSKEAELWAAKAKGDDND